MPSSRALVLAALAGVVAGAAAVYISGGFEGNTPAVPPEPAKVAAPAGEDDKACAAKADAAKALGAKAVGQVAAMTAADPPRSLKALAFNAPDGKPMTLADRAGKTVLMNLWATWCAPCRAEMPALDKLQADKGGDKFEVIAVNVDTGDDTKPKAFLQETSIASLAYYRENTLGLFNRLKEEGLALGLPVTLLIDPEGCLLAAMNGPAEWAGDDAKTLIDAALAAPTY
jgi:thiol-disulfide isomerase/thioredoxin